MRLAFLEFDLAEAAKIYKIAIFLGGVISETWATKLLIANIYIQILLIKSRDKFN